jgi:hypothetical protein
MRKIIIIVSLILIHTLSLVGAYLPTQEDFANSFDVHSIGPAPVYQRDISLKLTKDGTIYKDRYYIEQDNIDAMIGFTLPTNKEFIELKIIDLSGGDEKEYVLTKNIENLNQCGGYYQIENVNNTYLLLVCPFKHERESTIQLEVFFYNDEPCGDRIEKGLYFFTLNEFEILPSRKDFRLRLSALVDNDLYYNKTAQNITCGDNSKVHYLGNGFVCDGILNLPANYSRYIDFTLGGQDKEIIAKQDLENQLKEQWEMTNKQLKVVWIGIFISIIIALFPEGLKKLRRSIVKSFNRKSNKDNMKDNKRYFWQKIWEKEDAHLFGELFLIISAVLITKGLDQILSKTFSIILYLCFGFLFVWWGVKIMRSR